MAFDGTEQLTPLKDLLNSVITQAQARLQKGSTSVTFASAASATGTVTFPTPFASAPEVVATIKSASTSPLIGVMVSSPTTTGFTYTLYTVAGGTTSANRSFSWVAVL